MNCLSSKCIFIEIYLIQKIKILISLFKKKKKEDISINLIICLSDVIINIFTLLYVFKNI